MNKQKPLLRTFMGIALTCALACGDDSGSTTTTLPDGGLATPDAGPGGNIDASTNIDAGANDGGADASRPDGGDNTVLDVATKNSQFSYLVQYLGKAGLADTLDGPGPFTVFAPTDNAFGVLPEGTFDNITTDSLKQILSYHVLPQQVASSALTAGPVATLSGITAFLSTSGGLKINDANITMTDIQASNGVIHVIDIVLSPPLLLDAAKFAGGFSTLISAVDKAQLTDVVSSPDSTFTVFAPTDAAFAALPAGTLDALDSSATNDLLSYHSLVGAYKQSDLSAKSYPTILAGKSVTITLTPSFMVNDAHVTLADIVAANGVLHQIDKVLTIPQ